MLNAHKYFKVSRNSVFFFQPQISLFNFILILSVLLINVEMPAIVDILTFKSRKYFMLC